MGLMVYRLESNVVRMVVDGKPVDFLEGDSVALAMLRNGQHPSNGGTLCLAGDCGNCVAIVNSTAWVRTCQTPARPGLTVQRHTVGTHPSTTLRPSGTSLTVRHRHADLVVVGSGSSGRVAVAAAEADGRHTVVFDAGQGEEVVAVYPGPLVIARTNDAIAHVHAEEVTIAAGAAELHPVCPGNQLRGIYTQRAAATAMSAGIDLGTTMTVDLDGLVRFEGADGRVVAVITGGVDGERIHPCDSAIVATRLTSRDLLVRMTDDPDVHAVGSAAHAYPLPPVPTDGVICPCSGTTVEDLNGAWDRGFRELELLKRSTLCGTGTCQGAACQPHLRAYVTDRTGEIPRPFTGRPVARQITLGEAAANVYTDVFRHTPLHDEHLALGATMDRFGNWWRPWHYGDHVAEYWAVREAASLGDVSTLGKMVVSGPDVVEALERLYPTTIADIRPGRSRYVLLINERGHIFDDGMVLRESDTRFVLTFTSGGAANAEMWFRDWIESWGLDVRVMDTTMSLGAINVTGPLAGELLARCGVDEAPKFLQHRHIDVAGVPCHVMRLSFTGEASFELHHPADRSVELWRALLAAGRPLGVRPHGLQALFGMRLEKGHIIVGMDTDMDTTPRRVGMDWAVKMDKADFLGRDALLRTAGLPNQRTMVGLTVDGPNPTEGSPIWADGRIVGQVTSTFFSPGFGHTVMLGWFRYGQPDGQLTVDGRPATVAPTPFYDPEGHRARL